MNLLRKSAIVAVVAALVALASEAAPAVIALVTADGAAATSARPIYDVFTSDAATSGFRPANASLAILFDANWR
jgi:hypothetical protein